MYYDERGFRQAGKKFLVTAEEVVTEKFLTPTETRKVSDYNGKSFRRSRHCDGSEAGLATEAKQGITTEKIFK